AASTRRSTNWRKPVARFELKQKAGASRLFSWLRSKQLRQRLAAHRRGRNSSGIASTLAAAGGFGPHAPQVLQPSLQLPVACFGCSLRPNARIHPALPGWLKRIDAAANQRLVSF